LAWLASDLLALFLNVPAYGELPVIYGFPSDMVCAQTGTAGSLGIRLGLDYYRGELEPFSTRFDETSHTGLSVSLWARPTGFLFLSIRTGAGFYSFDSPNGAKSINGMKDGTFLIGLATPTPHRRLSVGAFMAVNLDIGSGERVYGATGVYDQRGLFSTFESDIALLGAVSYDLSVSSRLLPLVIHLNAGKEINLSETGSVQFPDTYPAGYDDSWRFGFGFSTVGERFSTSLSFVSRFDPDDGRSSGERQFYATPSADLRLFDRYFLGTTFRVTLSADDGSTQFDPSATWPDWQGIVYLGVTWNPKS
jgi:hypothetical protein